MMAPFLFKAPLGQHLCASLSVASSRFPSTRAAGEPRHRQVSQIPNSLRVRCAPRRVVAFPLRPSRRRAILLAGIPNSLRVRCASRRAVAFPLHPSRRRALLPPSGITNPNHKSKSQIHPLPFLGIPFHFGPLIQKILAAHLKSNPF